MTQMNTRPFKKLMARNQLIVCGLAILATALLPAFLCGQLSLNEPKTLTTKTGFTITGRLGSLPKMGATTADLRADSTHYGIVLIDDDMREVFLSRHNVANDVPLDQFEEEFEIWQRVHNGDGLGTEIGAILQIGPFDGFGRRQITIDSRRGPETVFQGITRINPRFVRLQGLVNSLGPEAYWCRLF